MMGFPLLLSGIRPFPSASSYVGEIKLTRSAEGCSYPMIRLACRKEETENWDDSVSGDGEARFVSGDEEVRSGVGTSKTLPARSRTIASDNHSPIRTPLPVAPLRLVNMLTFLLSYPIYFLSISNPVNVCTMRSLVFPSPYKVP